MPRRSSQEGRRWKSGRGGSERETLSDEGSRRECPQGEEAQESIRPRSDVKPRVQQGDGFSGGSKPLKRRSKVFLRSWEKAQERRARGNSRPIIRAEKSSEGESSGALGAEKALEEAKAERRRKGSQTLRAGPPGTDAGVPGRPVEWPAEKWGDRFRNMLESEKASARCFAKRRSLRGIPE